MAKMFRLLRADEIECRVSRVTASGVALLLYKDARCDMRILDETVGAYNWMKTYSRDNANCTVSLWDERKGLWIAKEDTGTESQTEKEKGLASDSFKRACFNWGIGRELYTAPFIWVPKDCANITPHPRKQGEFTCSDKFSVVTIDYDDEDRITVLTIRNNSRKAVCYTYGRSAAPAEKPAQPARRTGAAKAANTASSTPASPETLMWLDRCLATRTEDTTRQVLQWAKVTKLTDLTEQQALTAAKQFDPDGTLK